MSKKAYWISIYNEVLDSDKLAAYAALAGPALTAAGGRILARGMPATLYEHGQMQRTVLIEFESVEAANAAYKSAGYAEALAALDGGVVREVRIIEAAD